MIISNRESLRLKILDNVDWVKGCWIWKRSVNGDGYGNTWANGKSMHAHRLLYLIFKGEIKEGLCVCHHCDNPSCVNPEHLWLGSHKDNMKDMTRKKRTLYGEQRPNNKIPSTLYREIAKKYKNGITQIQLAKEYKCSPSAIWNAVHKIVPVGRRGFVGEKHPRAKLTASQVKEIKKLFKEKKSNKEISLIYNVTHQLINRIRKNIIWKHAT